MTEVLNTSSTITPELFYQHLRSNWLIVIGILAIVCALFMYDFSSVAIVSVCVIVGWLVFTKAMEYFFSVNLTAGLNSKTLDIVLNTSIPKIDPADGPFHRTPGGQVFNIPGNVYTYDEAKAVCKAYDASLATYSQIENAYNKGGEWCNYGWSADQMALYPTQKKTYDNLQTIKGHEHDCGRPGINGGYIANPAVRFGVNCYGKKPGITDEEQTLLETSTPYPETKQDLLFQAQVNYWKSKINDILVSPFNYDSWNATRW